jgi:hypothetical protein
MTQYIETFITFQGADESRNTVRHRATHWVEPSGLQSTSDISVYSQLYNAPGGEQHY